MLGYTFFKLDLDASHRAEKTSRRQYAIAPTNIRKRSNTTWKRSSNPCSAYFGRYQYKRLYYYNPKKIIPLSATVTALARQPPAESTFIVDQAIDFFSQTVSLQIGHLNSEFQTDHCRLLISKPTMNKTT